MRALAKAGRPARLEFDYQRRIARGIGWSCGRLLAIRGWATLDRRLIRLLPLGAVGAGRHTVYVRGGACGPLAQGHARQRVDRGGIPLALRGRDHGWRMYGPSIAVLREGGWRCL